MYRVRLLDTSKKFYYVYETSTVHVDVVDSVFHTYLLTRGVSG